MAFACRATGECPPHDRIDRRLAMAVTCSCKRRHKAASVGAAVHSEFAAKGAAMLCESIAKRGRVPDARRQEERPCRMSTWFPPT
jgi:hypothetical protein